MSADRVTDAGILPPHEIIDDALPRDLVESLRGHVLESAAAFRPSAVRRGEIDTATRLSTILRDVGPRRGDLEAHLRSRLPDLAAALGIAPFAPRRLELELVASGNGAHYGRHIDLRTGDAPGASRTRTVTAVHYLSFDPPRFTGGALRLHAIGARDARHVDVEPRSNRLVAFPAWAPHEVLPVSCASDAIADHRLSLNCWYHREG